jgi:hypothetical protein
MAILYIRSKTEAGFNRCKKRWGREWTEYEATDEEENILRSEVRLEVRDTKPASMDADAKRRRMALLNEDEDDEVGTHEGEVPPAHGPSTREGQVTPLGKDHVPSNKRRATVFEIKPKPETPSVPTGAKQIPDTSDDADDDDRDEDDDRDDDEERRAPVKAVTPAAARAAANVADTAPAEGSRGGQAPAAPAPKTSGPAAGPKAAKANQDAARAAGGASSEGGKSGSGTKSGDGE